MSTWGVFAVIECIVLALVTYKLVHFYAAKDTPLYVLVLVFSAWYLGFFATLFLPIDIAEAYNYVHTHPDIPINSTCTNTAYIWNGTDCILSPPIERMLQEVTPTPFPTPTPVPSAAPSVTPSPTPAPPEPVLPDIYSGYKNPSLEALWYTLYWLTAIITFIFNPMAQEYVAAGEFTVRERLIGAVRQNLIYYCSIAVVALAGLIYILASTDKGLLDLFALLISLANTYGLFYIIITIGYGAADIPRYLWNRARPLKTLHEIYFVAPEMDSKVLDTRVGVVGVLKSVSEFSKRLEAMGKDSQFLAEGSNEVTYRELMQCMAIVSERVRLAEDILKNNGDRHLKRGYPQTSTVKGGVTGATAPSASSSSSAAESALSALKRIVPASSDVEVDEEDDGLGFMNTLRRKFTSNSKYSGVSVSKLASLHKSLKDALIKYRKAQNAMNSLIIRGTELEYVSQSLVPPIPIKRQTVEGTTYYVLPPHEDLDHIINESQGVVQGASGNNGKGKLDFVNSVSTSRNAPAQRVPQGYLVNPGEELISLSAAESFLGMMVMPRAFNGVINRFSWRFRIHMIPWVYRLLAVAMEILSLILIWCEITIFVNLSGMVEGNLSVFGLMVQAADKNQGDSFFAIQVAATVPLLYMVICTAYTMFNLKIFDVFQLSGNQNTEPYSLIMCANLFSRLQFSIAFNFLNVLVHSRNKIDFPRTAFMTSVGKRMALSYVDWYLPLLILVVYVICKFNLFHRLVQKLGFEDYGVPDLKNRSHQNTIRDGMVIIRKGRRTLGMSADGQGEDEEAARAQQEQVSRDRLKLVMARAMARREGRNPDKDPNLRFSALNGMDREILADGNPPQEKFHYANESHDGRPVDLSLAAMADNVDQTGVSGFGNDRRQFDSASGTFEFQDDAELGIVSDYKAKYQGDLDIAAGVSNIRGGYSGLNAVQPPVKYTPPPPPPASLSELLKGQRKF